MNPLLIYPRYIGRAISAALWKRLNDCVLVRTTHTFKNVTTGSWKPDGTLLSALPCFVRPQRTSYEKSATDSAFAIAKWSTAAKNQSRVTHWLHFVPVAVLWKIPQEECFVHWRCGCMGPYQSAPPAWDNLGGQRTPLAQDR